MENLSTEVPAEKTAGEKVFKKIDREKRRADKARTGFIIATVVPSLVLFLLFVILPVFNMLYTSFFSWDGIGDKVFIKTENYEVLFHNEDFWSAFKNTLFLIFFVTIFTIGFALFFAAVLSKGKTKGKTFFPYRILYPEYFVHCRHFRYFFCGIRSLLRRDRRDSETFR
mgnify:CR=1 FL=1